MKSKSSRILFTSTYSQPYLSGITDYIANVTKYIAKTNPVTLVSFQHLPTLPKVENISGVKQIRLAVHFKLSKGFINFFYPYHIWQQVKQHDQVFINTPQVEGVFAAIAAKMLGKRLTVIYHCELFFESGLLLKLIAFIANIFSWLTVALSDQIVVYTQDYAQASLILKNWLKKVVAIPPPISLVPAESNFGQKLKTKYQNSFPVLGFSGRVSREKGLDYLFKALDLLAKDFPHIKLVCAGPYGDEVAGEGEYFAELQKIIQLKKLPVEWLGRLSKSQLSSFYQNITLLVLPSINKTEAFGMVQAEALLAGKPVVTSNLPGVRACVSLTGCGRVVEPKKPSELARAIKDLITDLPSENTVKLQANKYFGGNQTHAWFKAVIAEV